MTVFAFSCVYTPTTIQIQEKILEFNDVDAFVSWLGEQSGISNVRVNKQIFLTSLPPKVRVTYYKNAVKHELLLQVEPGHKLELVK